MLRAELAAVLGRERFLAEIRLTAKLNRPHIVTLLDSGEAAGPLYYVVAYVRGESGDAVEGSESRWRRAECQLRPVAARGGRVDPADEEIRLDHCPRAEADVGRVA